MSNKHIISFVLSSLLLLPLFFSSCSKELELFPEGSILLPEQLNEAWKSDPSKASAVLAGMYDELKKIDRLERRGALLHSDYGYPNQMNLSEVRTGSMWLRHASGRSYDFMYAGMFDYTENTPQSLYVRMIYASYYAYIKAANDYLTSATADDPQIKQTRGEAMAFRAFAYFELIQMYQFNYKGNEDKPGVPLILETTPPEQALTAPRASVKEVYDQIEKDLLEAKELLKNKTEGVETINLYTVNGLLARFYLTKGEYAKAEEAAKDVIDHSKKTPYSLDEASYPHFADATDHNVLWGIVWTANDENSKSIISWTSMNSPIKKGGYATVAPRCLNPAIFATIKDTDVRKAWWVTTDPSAPDLKGFENYVTKALKLSGAAADAKMNEILTQFQEPFVNACVKFAPPSTSDDDFTGDYPMMRIEEMYYILAEAQYRGGNKAGGIATLENFVKTYREPGYTVAAYGDFESEIVRQKQIEFFGEGVPYFDMMRLNLKMIRSNSKAVKDVYPAKTRFDLEPSDPRRLLQFPEREVLLNPKVEQNQYVEPPKDQF